MCVYTVKQVAAWRPLHAQAHAHANLTWAVYLVPKRGMYRRLLRHMYDVNVHVEKVHVFIHVA